MKRKELPPIRETKEDFEGLEREIMKVLQREIYLPLVKELRTVSTPNKAILKNSKKVDDLATAIRAGRVHYSGGLFTGRLSAGVSRELSKLGARWDPRHGGWRIPATSLPPEYRSLLAISDSRFKRVLESIDRKLGELLPSQISENVKMAHFFDRTLFRIDQEFKKQVRGITVVPTLTPETRAAVAEGYTLDLRRYIEDFSRKEILRLRTQVRDHTLSGTRYEGLVETIEASYGVTERKAKFLARQETALLMTAFKKSRYQEAGLNRYRWQCVVGSPKHPVRPAHKRLDGKEYSWDSPPITDEKGNRNHPGEDYNCRCVARPIVTFK